MANNETERYAREGGEGALAPFTTICLALALVFFGLLIVYSATFELAKTEGNPHYYYFFNVAFAALIAFTFSLLTFFIPLKHIGELWFPLFLLSAFVSATKIFSIPNLPEFVPSYDWGLLYSVTALFISCSIIPDGNMIGIKKAGSYILSILLIAIMLALCFFFSTFSYFVLTAIVVIHAFKAKRMSAILRFILLLILLLLCGIFFTTFEKGVVSLSSVRDVLRGFTLTGHGLGRGNFKNISASASTNDALLMVLDEVGYIGLVVYFLVLFLIAVVAIRAYGRNRKNGKYRESAFSLCIAVFVIAQLLINILSALKIYNTTITSPFVAYNLLSEFFNVFLCALLYRFVYNSSKTTDNTQGGSYYGY